MAETANKTRAAASQRSTRRGFPRVRRRPKPPERALLSNRIDNGDNRYRRRCHGYLLILTYEEQAKLADPGRFDSPASLSRAERVQRALQLSAGGIDIAASGPADKGRHSRAPQDL